ncbi:MAG: hypothetical protein ACK5GI_04505 [Ignavibacteria bacterium]
MNIFIIALLALIPVISTDDIPMSRVNTLDTCAVYFVPFYEDTTVVFGKLQQLGLTRTPWRTGDTTKASVTYTWIDETFMYGFTFKKGKYVGAEVTYYSPRIIDRMAWFRRHADAWGLSINGTTDAQIEIYPCADGMDRGIGVFFVPDGGVLVSVMVGDTNERKQVPNIDAPIISACGDYPVPFGADSTELLAALGKTHLVRVGGMVDSTGTIVSYEYQDGLNQRHFRTYMGKYFNHDLVYYPTDAIDRYRFAHRYENEFRKGATDSLLERNSSSYTIYCDDGQHIDASISGSRGGIRLSISSRTVYDMLYEGE